MNKQLNISATETLPLEFLSLRSVVYGGSGAGKTAFGRVIVEESIKTAGIPCGVIDLKADWWGLKSSADGKHDGLPVIVFGGDHADVPIHENGGAELAEIVAELRQSFIIDLEAFSKAKQLKFLAPFFDRLYDKNRHPLKLICDEADRYIPQRILTKDANAPMCLGAGEDIAKRGRKHGIFPMFIAQRNADLNKGVAELCDAAVIFRTSGPNDQRAVEDWFEAKGSLVTAEQREQAMANIAAQADGQAIFCCAHPHLKIFKKVQMRMPTTFDSSATPAIGQELVQPKKFAPIELESLSQRMRATIEKAKENDPKELKAEVARLKAELKRRDAVGAASPVETKEVPILTDSDRALLNRVLDEGVDRVIHSFETLQAKTAESIADMRNFLKPVKDHLAVLVANADNEALRRANPGLMREVKQILARSGQSGIQVRRSQTAATTTPGRSALPANGSLPKAEAAILRVLANFPDGKSKREVGVIAGYKHSGGGFNNAVGKLRSLGYVTSGDPLRITAEGLAAHGPVQPLPTGEELFQYWMAHPDLGKAEREILRVLYEARGEALTKEEIAPLTQSDRGGPYEANGGGFNNALGKLRTYELVEGKGDIRAVAQFFN